MLASVFAKWNIVSRSTAPLRRKIRAAANEMFYARLERAKRTMFDALRSVSVGKESRVQQNKERREFIAKIRFETSEKLKQQGLKNR